MPSVSPAARTFVEWSKAMDDASRIDRLLRELILASQQHADALPKQGSVDPRDIQPVLHADAVTEPRAGATPAAPGIQNGLTNDCARQ
jgi:hypothetical protein